MRNCIENSGYKPSIVWPNRIKSIIEVLLHRRQTRPSNVAGRFGLGAVLLYPGSRLTKELWFSKDEKTNLKDRLICCAEHLRSGALPECPGSPIELLNDY